jgi:hypothetical protein
MSLLTSTITTDLTRPWAAGTQLKCIHPQPVNTAPLLILSTPSTIEPYW